MTTRVRPRIAWIAAAAAALSGCVTLTELPRGVSSMGDGSLQVAAIGCETVRVPPSEDASAALDPRAIRLFSWNLHKQGDPGWERDLARFAGRDVTLAVVNLHAINFEVTLTPYEAQLDALVRVLARHRGPIAFAGDFNTWSDGRRAAMRAAADALGLTEVPLDPDGRATFYGQQLDHVMVRGLAVLAASATVVQSSDHNPVAVTLQVAPPR